LHFLRLQKLLIETRLFQMHVAPRRCGGSRGKLAAAVAPLLELGAAEIRLQVHEIPRSIDMPRVER